MNMLSPSLGIGLGPTMRPLQAGGEVPLNIYTTDNANEVVQASPAGSHFIFEAGVHRLPETIAPREGDTFTGEPGAVISGAKVLTGWTQDGDVWYVTGQTQGANPNNYSSSCETGWGRCGYLEDLFIDDVRMRHAEELEDVEPGRWFFDYDADRIYIGDDPDGHTIETSTILHAFNSDNDDVTIKGLTIEKFASPAQRGAIWSSKWGDPSYTHGENWLIENNIVRLNHGQGISTGHGAIVRGNKILDNGQMGLGSSGGGTSGSILVENNEIAFSNGNHYQAGWEAGGMKLIRSDGAIIRNNYSHHNRGPGLWTDIDNINTLYEDNIVEDNLGMGIFHEISYDAVIRNNVVRRNGFDAPTWYSWGYNSGILISNSPNVEVHDNVVEYNRNGITAVDQNRGTGAYGDYIVKDANIHDNYVLMQYNEDVQGGSGMGHRSFTGIVRDHTHDPFDDGNVFSDNVYRVPGSTGSSWFNWANDSRNWTAWKGYGHDVDGSLEQLIQARVPGGNNSYVVTNATPFSEAFTDYEFRFRAVLQDAAWQVVLSTRWQDSGTDAWIGLNGSKYWRVSIGGKTNIDFDMGAWNIWGTPVTLRFLKEGTSLSLYYRTDERADWTFFGTKTVSAGAHNTTNKVAYLGADYTNGGDGLSNGSIYYAQMWTNGNEWTGDLVLDFDPSKHAEDDEDTSWTAPTTGETWTIGAAAWLSALTPPPPLNRTNVFAEYWLDDGSGQYANDTSGNAYHLRLGSSDSDTSYDPDWVSSGLRFEHQDFAHLGSVPSISGSMFIEIVAKVDSVTSKENTFVEFWDTDGEGSGRMLICGSGNLRFTGTTSANWSNYFVDSGGGHITANTWFHAIAEYQGTGAIRIWINGELANSGNWSSSGSATPSGGTFRLSTDAGWGPALIGNMAYAAVYTRAIVDNAEAANRYAYLMEELSDRF